MTVFVEVTSSSFTVTVTRTVTITTLVTARTSDKPKTILRLELVVSCFWGRNATCDWHDWLHGDEVGEVLDGWHLERSLVRDLTQGSLPNVNDISSLNGNEVGKSGQS
jgi:hypothetical protein